MEVQFHEDLTSALDAGEWSTSLPDRLTKKEWAPSNYWTRGWVGHRTRIGENWRAIFIVTAVKTSNRT
jgi:hypothetical protein